MKKLLIILLLCSSAFGQFQQEPMLGEQISWIQPSSKGLVAYWPMNERLGNKVFDLSGNGNTGTFNGTAPSWSAGRFGSAVLLPGTDEYIDCGNSSILNPPAISVIVWFNANSFSNYQYVVHRVNDSFGPYRLELGNTNAYIAVGDNTAVLSASANHNASVGEWHQLAFTYDGAFLGLYFDGILIGSNTGAIVMESNNLSTMIGQDPGFAAFFDGQIGQVMLYNRPLSLNEMAKLYPEPFSMFQKDDIALMALEAPPAPGGGQLIFINMAKVGYLPVIVILFFYCFARRKICQTLT